MDTYIYLHTKYMVSANVYNCFV